MKIQVSATGSVIKGHVLDCARAPLEAKLQDYDPQLYIQWNPKKLRGWGCWELRRKPEAKSVRIEDIIQYQGVTYVMPKYHELNLINHVMDIPFLNYDIFGKLIKMDTWLLSERGKDFTAQIDYAEAKFDEKMENKAIEDAEYTAKQFKKEIRWFKDYILSGGDPSRIAEFWNDV